MDPVTVWPKFQVVIPQRIREALGLVPGVKMQVVQYEGRIEFIPVRPAKKPRGRCIDGAHGKVMFMYRFGTLLP